MKINIHQLSLASKAVNALLKVDMPVTLAFKLNRVLNRINADLREADKQRIVLLHKFGTPNKDNADSFTIPDENTVAFSREMNELYKVEVEVDFELIPLSSFQNVNCKLEDMIGLSVLIDDAK